MSQTPRIGSEAYNEQNDLYASGMTMASDLDGPDMDPSEFNMDSKTNDQSAPKQESKENADPGASENQSVAEHMDQLVAWLNEPDNKLQSPSPGGGAPSDDNDASEHLDNSNDDAIPMESFNAQDSLKSDASPTPTTPQLDELAPATKVEVDNPEVVEEVAKTTLGG